MSTSASPPSTPPGLDALRSLLDARLAALEAALSDPDQHGSLEQIILDLARLATQEADAAARQAYLDAQREGQGALAAVRAESRSAVEAERGTAASLRGELEQAQAALSRERSERSQALAAMQQERTAVAARERDFSALAQSLEQEKAARAALQRELEQGRTAVLKGFESKSGKKFEARLKLEGGDVRFDFGT